jgi:hypothetical protein
VLQHRARQPGRQQQRHDQPLEPAVGDGDLAEVVVQDRPQRADPVATPPGVGGERD